MDKIKESKEMISYRTLKVSDSAAKEIVSDILIQLKNQGNRQVDVIDLHTITKLPPEQISRIMNTLEKESIVSAYGEN